MRLDRPEAAHDLAESAQNIPVAMQARDSALSIIRLVVDRPRARRHGFECQRHQARTSAAAAMMSWQSLGCAFAAWSSCRPCRRHGLLDFAELGLHQRIDLAPDLAAGRGEQAQYADVLRQMIAQRARCTVMETEAQ